jgi:hypothetical protein
LATSLKAEQRTIDFRSPFAGLGTVFYIIDFYSIDGFGQTDYQGLESVVRTAGTPREVFSDTPFTLYDAC